MDVNGQLATATVTNNGTLNAESVKATLGVDNNANATMTINGQILAGTNGVENDGTLKAGSVATTGSVGNNAGGNMQVNGDISAASVTNKGEELKAAGQISAATVDNQTGKLYASSIDATEVNNDANMDVNGEISAQTVINTAGLNAGSIDASGEVQNKGTTSSMTINGELSAASVDNQGTLSAESVKSTGAVTNETGTMTVNGQIMAATVTNNSTAENAAGAALSAASIAAAGDITNNAGTMRVGGSVSSNGNLTNSGTMDIAGLAAITGNVTNNATGDFYANGMNVGTNVLNDGTMTVDNTFDVSGTLTNNDSLTTNGYTTVKGVITNTGTWNAEEIRARNQLINAGTINLFSNMTVTNGIENTDGTINGTSAGSSLQAQYLTGGTVNNIETLTTMGANPDGEGISDAILNDVVNVNVRGNVNMDNTVVNNTTNLVVTGNLTNSEITMSGNGSRMTVNGNVEQTAIANVGNLHVVGETNNEGKNISGSGNGSVLTFDNNLTAAEVTNFDKLQVNGDATVTTLTGASHDTSAEVTNDLTSDGLISRIDKMTVGHNLTAGTWNVDGTLNGANLIAPGRDSVYNIGNDMYAGNISGIDSLTVGGTLLTQAAEPTSITGTGYNSLLDVGALVSDLDTNIFDDTLTEYETVAVRSNLNTSGTMTGTGTPDSKLIVKSKPGNFMSLTNSGKISGYGYVQTGSVINSGTINSIGAGSVYDFRGTLANSGTITNVASLQVAGNAVNTGMISATDGIRPLADGLYSSFVVSGNFDNGTTNGTTITIWHPENIGTAGNDVRDEMRTEYPAFQTYADLTERTDIARLDGYSNVSISGKVTNNANGIIQGTDKGSTYTFGTLDNAGVVNMVETLNIDGTNNPRTFQVATTVQTSRPQGTYNTYGAINANLVADQGDLVNRNGGLIRGTGAGSSLNVSGNAYNMFGSTIRNYETINIDGSLANEGVLEFAKNVRIQGDFVNSLTYEEDSSNALGRNAISSNATGGVLVTNTYNGQLGQMTVEGNATINGGQLWIGNSGEQLAVGKDYTIINVKSGHLTVTEPLQIRALNEYDYDTMWENNSDPAFSSNSSASATPRLFHAEGFHTDSTYYVSLRRDYVYGANGRTVNERNFGRYIDAIAYTLNSTDDNYEQGDLFNVLSALDNENIKAGNVPDSDYGYKKADGTYTYASGQTSQAAHEALEQLSGSVYANMGTMALQNTWLVTQHLSDFLRPNFCIQCNECNYGPIDRCCNCSDEGDSCLEKRGIGFGRNFWGMYYGNTGDIYADGNAGAFDYQTNGFIIGADLFCNNVSRYGIYGSFGDNRISMDNMNQSVKSSSYNIGLYGIHEFCLGNLMANAAIGRDDYRSSRHLAFGRLPANGAYGNHNSNYVDREHRGNTESTQATFRLEQSWNYVVWNTVLQPFLAGSYTHLQMDGLNETTVYGDREDGRYVTELSSGAYELDSLRSELGLRASRCLLNNNRSLNIHGHASWVHEYGDTSATIENSFTNKNYDDQETGYNSGYNTIANNAFNSNQYNVCSYTVSGVDLGSDFVWAGVGLTYSNLCKCATLFGGYDILANEQTTLHNATAGVQFDW